MLDSVSSASEEVACPAVLPRGSSDTLGDLVVIRGEVFLLVAFENLRFGDRVSCSGGKLLVGSGLLMTDQAVYLCLVGKIKVLVFPSVSCVA